MNIYIYILILLVLVFIYEVVTKRYKKSHIENLLKDLDDFISDCVTVLNENHYAHDYDYNFENGNVILGKHINNDKYKKALSGYPEIQQLLPNMFNTSLSYNNDLFDNLNSAKFIFNELLMVKNKNHLELKNLFNPSVILKITLRLPSSFLSYIGFNAKTTSKNIFNSIFWITTTLYNLFSSEIKSVILAFVKNVS